MPITELTTAEIENYYRFIESYNYDLYLKFGDCLIRVEANSEKLIDHLRRYYEPFVTGVREPIIQITVCDTDPPDFNVEYITQPAEPGKRRIKEEYHDFPDGRLVRKRFTGMCFMFGGCKNLAIGPAVDNNNQVVNFINNRYMEWMLKKGMILAHAAGVASNGRGIAMAGMSGKGKSTLCLHLLSRGLDYISNDRLLLDRLEGVPQMWGVPKLPRINPGTVLNNPNLTGMVSEEEAEWLRTLPADRLWHMEQKYDVYLDDCFSSSRFLLRAPINLIVMLNWDFNGGKTIFNRIDFWSRRDLLKALMKSPGLFYQPENGCEPDFSMEPYLNRLRGCSVLEITGGVDFEVAADVCLEHINTFKTP